MSDPLIDGLRAKMGDAVRQFRADVTGPGIYMMDDETLRLTKFERPKQPLRFRDPAPLRIEFEED